MMGYSMKFFLCVIGGMMILEGLPFAAFPERMKMGMQQLLGLAPDILQKAGFVFVILGFLLIYIGMG